MQNRNKIHTLLNHYKEELQVVPEYSKLGDNNWRHLNEGIFVMEKCLNAGTLPNMDLCVDDLTMWLALWLLEKNTMFDDLLEELSGAA